MIDALVSGKLHGKPIERTGGSGKVFVTAKVSAAAGAGAGVFVNVIAFGNTIKAALLALDDGDSVALSGSLTPKAWIDRNGDAQPALDMTAHSVLTPYHIKRKRVAVRPAEEPQQQPQQHQQARPAASASDDLPDDDLDF